MKPVDMFIETLEREGIHPVRSGRGWKCLCPAHKDSTESLSVGEGDDGRVLVKCFAGCTTESVVTAAGLTMADLFPRDGRPGSTGRTMKRAVKGVTTEYRPERRYDYTDESGARVAWVQRWTPKTFTQGRWLANNDQIMGLGAGWYGPGKGAKEWWPVKDADGRPMRDARVSPPPEAEARWLTKCPPMLFRLPNVLWAASAGARVFVVEGEKDALALEGIGEVATTWLKAGSSSKKFWVEKFTEQLRGAEVWVVRDRDQTGHSNGLAIMAALRSGGVDARLVEACSGKDAADHLAAGYSVADFVAEGSPGFGGQGSDAAPVTVGEEFGPFALTDVGNAERLVAQFGADIRWCEGFREWLHWDGTVWKPDSTHGMILNKAISIAQGLVGETARAGFTGDPAEWLAWGVKSQMRPRVEAIVELAKGLPGTQVGYWELDARPDLLATPSGTVELRTKTLRPGRREDLLTRRTAVAFDPDARPERWSTFLAEVCEAQEWMFQYLWRAIGYGATGEVGEHCLFFLHGRGNNGKSTLVETVRRVLGDVALASESDTLMAQDRGSSAIRTDIARLKEARFVAIEETAKGGRFDAGTVKRLTGGTRIVARTVYKPEIEFDPQCKFFVCGNHKPNVTETDDGTWRRMRLIPFRAQVPPAQVDKRLGEKLWAEAPGILGWIIEGARRWYERGLAEPDEVTCAVAEYRDEMDTLGHFMRERVKEASDLRAAAKPLYEGYKRWAREGNHYVLNIKQFTVEMKDRGYRQVRHSQGVVWQDLELLPDGLDGTE